MEKKYTVQISQCGIIKFNETFKSSVGDSNMKIAAKNIFAASPLFDFIRVYDDHDNLVCQFMR